MTTTAHRTVSEIEADLKAAGIKRDNFRRLINEGQGGYVDETEIEALSAELAFARKASCPLTLDLAGERAWFNAQGFTPRDLQAANNACNKRGYSLAMFQAACKAAK
jgi:hypothetical protein